MYIHLFYHWTYDGTVVQVKYYTLTNEPYIIIKSVIAKLKPCVRKLV